MKVTIVPPWVPYPRGGGGINIHPPRNEPLLVTVPSLEAMGHRVSLARFDGQRWIEERGDTLTVLAWAFLPDPYPA